LRDLTADGSSSALPGAKNVSHGTSGHRRISPQAVLSLIMVVCVTLITYVVMRDSLFDKRRLELMALARTGAAFIDPDGLGYVAPGQEQSEAYLALRSQLDRIVAGTPQVRYAYLLVPTVDPGSFRFLADTDREKPAAIGEILDAHGYPDLMKAVSGPTADHAFTTDRWGNWLSGYAPIRDDSGQTVAVLGVDLPADEVHRGLIWVGVVSGGLGFIVWISMGAIGHWVYSRLTRRVRDLASGVHSLSQRIGETESEASDADPDGTEQLLHYYERLVSRLEESQDRLSDLFDQTLTALAAAVRTRDTYTGDHSLGMAQLTEEMAVRLGIGAQDRTHLRYASALHDIGKIGVPDGILLKPGPLTEEERLVIQTHPRLGYELLWQVEALRPVAEVVLAHHERWDGQGYPRGLAGAEIPLLARIVSVADAYSAMTTDRPYRGHLQQEVAIAELRRYAGSQFDPAVVQVFIEVLSADEISVAAV